MPRDPLAVLHRLRRAAVDEASAELSRALARERQAVQRRDAQAATLGHEQAAAAGPDLLAFVEWLPHARQRLADLSAAAKAELERVRKCQDLLAERRTAAEAVAKALRRQHDALALRQARREQAVLDEAAGRRHALRAGVD